MDHQTPQPSRHPKHTHSTFGKALRATLTFAVALGLTAGVAEATKYDHTDNFESHALYLESEGVIDAVYTCTGEYFCTPDNGAILEKTYREKTVHLVNLTGRKVQTVSRWLDLGYDDERGTNADTLLFGCTGVPEYVFDPDEDTYYRWPSTGTWTRQDTVEAGTSLTIHERLDSLMFLYVFDCPGVDFPHNDTVLGFNGFDFSANVWETVYACEGGGAGIIEWEEPNDLWSDIQTAGGPADSTAYFVLGENACSDPNDVTIVEGELATGWLDRDDPGNDGDLETLADHSLDPTSVPDYLVGVEPAYVEMRRVSDGADVRYTGDAFELRTNLGGTTDVGSDDYKVQFHYGWTPWMDRDNSYGSGDYEGDWHYTQWSNPGAQFPGRMPQRNPTMVQCRAKEHEIVVFTRDASDGTDVIEGDFGDDKTRLFWCNTETGFVCNNDYNTERGYPSCHGLDFEVRFFFGHEPICDGNLLDGLDDGWCNATAGEAKLVAQWDSNLCLNAAGANTASNGSNVNTYYCTWVTERWRFNQETGKIHAAWNDGQCLNAVGNNTATAGTQVNVYDCNSVTETWSYDESTGKIHAGWNSSLCLNVQGNNSSSSSNVNVWNCDGVLETWDIVYE